MSILGIGIDIVEINRIKKIDIFFRNKLAKRILSKKELSKYLVSCNKIQFLIKRFCVKEALAKALGTGIRNKISFKHFEIYNNRLGKPKIKFLKNTFSYFHKIKKKHVSISHEKKYFCSIVILEN
ncbi:holo-ACP synthase [Buchnera aphidicola (Chaitoregma tattakana)]|uniref:holo-ACP synthase n=1 Tax=Buchnera aphidicola TaxID=9 RepID=UPI0031B847ED